MTRVRAFTTVTAVSALLLAMIAIPASATHSWGNYHWARTAPEFTLEVIDSVTDDWQFEFTTALDEWDNATALEFSVVAADDGARTRKRCSSSTGQMRVCNDSYGNNGWLGLASITIDGQGHITSGTAKMNDSYSSYWADPNEKRHVMCQEIGHVFGLGHTSEDGSSQATCMDYSNSPSSISPNAHDYNLLASIYTHLDSYNSYATSDGGSGGGGDKPCNPKKPGCAAAGGSVNGREFGELVSSSDRNEIWVKRGPGGTVEITHLYLVEAH